MPADGSDRLPAPLQYRDPARYEIVAEHGRGGLGRVFRARDKELGRDVALKELLSRGSTSELRFFREALITARLEHPGIVPVHEAGRWPDGTPFYAMKLVAGRPLKALIDECKTLEDRLALLPHVIAVADAIAYAHDRKIIHRDLKPSNIIVGDFGETVVIDWGLAKDISDQGAPEDVVEDGPFRTAAPAGDGVTVAGSVVGTPAYMSPEQARGEPVDERTDVYAIGAILQHVFVGVPPPVPLPMSLARDLRALVGRCLASDRAARYRAASVVARDLRAFHTGHKVSAREYSALASASLWVRRHRAIAFTALFGAAAVFLVGMVSLWNVTRSRNAAVRAQSSAEEARDELVLKNAHLMLAVDPTRALAALDMYQGDDHVRYSLLRAEAMARGVATHVWKPHADTVWRIDRPSADTVLSASEDHSVALSSLKHREPSQAVLARAADATRIVYLSKARTTFYARSPSGLGAIRGDGNEMVVDPQVQVRALASHATSDRVLVAGRDHSLTLWSASNLQRLVTTTIGSDVLAATAIDGGWALATSDSVVWLSPELEELTRTPFPGATQLIASRHVLAGASDTGEVFLRVDATAKHEGRPCQTAVNAIAILGDSLLVACPGGTLHTITPEGGVATQSFTTEIYVVAVSDDGRYIGVGGQNGTFFLVDTQTRLTHVRHGHRVGVSAIAPATETVPYFDTGDVDGELRRWSLPEDSAREVLRGPTTIYGAELSPDGTVLVADSADGVLRHLEVASGRVRELRGHKSAVFAFRYDPSGGTFVSFGHDGTLHLWNTRDGALRASATVHDGPIASAVFGRHGIVYSVGQDGRLAAWDPVAGTVRTVHQHDSSFLNVIPRSVRGAESLIVYDTQGSLLSIEPTSAEVRTYPTSGGQIRMGVLASDRTRMYVGTGDGQVDVVDLDTGTRKHVLSTRGPIRDLAISPRDGILAVASEGGTVHLVAIAPGVKLPWVESTRRVRYMDFSHRGDMLALAAVDGTTWIEQLEPRWIPRMIRVHQSDSLSLYFSGDDAALFSSDVTGHVVRHDVSALFSR